MLSRSTAIAVVACTAAPQATAFVAAPLPVARLGAARSTATRPAVHALRATAAAGVNTASGVVPGYGDLTNVQLSGLNGKALKDKEFPSVAAVKKAMPEGTWVRDDKISLMYAAKSTILSLGCLWAALTFMPLSMSGLMPLAWLAYWYVAGTVWTGAWVIAHECGHGAFSDNKTLQDTVGYILHTALLVPYFSWQRSHAVHHSKTNHVLEGETHVPYTMESGKKTLAKQQLMRKVFGHKIGSVIYGGMRMVSHLLFGWPAYLLAGVTGGPVRGVTNHFIPVKPFSTGDKNTELFPGAWKNKVWMSDVGIVAMIAALTAWASTFGFWHMAAFYLGPLAITNCWLVMYTWLQHTDVDVPHFTGSNWNYIKGAFMTIDRPYGKIFDFLHHRIGSTHVVHHIDCTIPHYRAKAATEAIKETFPDHYLYDPTPLPEVLWRVSTECVAVEERDNKWVFVQGDGVPKLPAGA